MQSNRSKNKTVQSTLNDYYFGYLRYQHSYSSTNDFDLTYLHSDKSVLVY